MTGGILDTILAKLNSRISRQNRSILLLLDNAGCHPDHLKEKYSNIKICYFTSEYHIKAAAT